MVRSMLPGPMSCEGERACLLFRLVPKSSAAGIDGGGE